MSEFNPQQLASYDTAGSMAKGFGLAQGISQNMLANQERDQLRAAQESLINDPSPRNVLAVSVRHPQLGAGIKQAFENMDIEERKRRVSTAIPIYAASLNGRGDIAKKMLLQQAAAMEASGGDPEEIARLKETAELAVDDPATFQKNVGTSLAYGMGDKHFAATFVALEKAKTESEVRPFTQAEKMAKSQKDLASASIDQAKAPYAAETAAAELAIKKLEPWNMQADNANNAAQVEAMQGINRLKQDEINQTLEDKQRTAEEKKIEQQAGHENYKATVDNTRNVVKSLLNHPGLNTDPKLRVQAEQHPELSAGTDAFDFSQMLTTLKGLNFLQGVQAIKGQGAGALSDTESKYIVSTLGALHPGMSNEALKASLTSISNTLDNAEKRANTKAKVQQKAGVMAPESTLIPAPVDNPAWLKYKAERGMK